MCKNSVKKKERKDNKKVDKTENKEGLYFYKNTPIFIDVFIDS